MEEPDLIFLTDDEDNGGGNQLAQFDLEETIVLSSSDEDDVVFVGGVSKSDGDNSIKTSKRKRKRKKKCKIIDLDLPASTSTPNENAKTSDAVLNSRKRLLDNTQELPLPKKTKKLWADNLVEIEAEALRQINESKQNFVCLVAGVKNVGKSTFCRQVMNRFLEKGLSVYHLECDPGQTEFTPPGCLSLTEVVERISGPPFLHLRMPLSCKFFGEPSPANRMQDYISCIRRLITDFERISSETSPSCLVVNTCGWLDGAGLTALLDICRVSNPHQILLLFSHNATGSQRDATMISQRQMSSTLPSSRLSLVDGCGVNCELDLVMFPRSKPSVFREAALLAYFGQTISIKNRLDLPRIKFSVNIRTTKPYAVPMSEVYVSVVHGAPPPAYILSIMNASLVALCRYEKDGGQWREDKHWLDDRSLPKILDDDVSNVQCLGFGVIRGVNVEERIFYLYTTLSKEKLARVNAFLKGDISLPSAVFECQLVTFPSVGKAKQQDQGLPTQLPYLVRGRRSLDLDDEHLVLGHLDDGLSVRERRRRVFDERKANKSKKKRVESIQGTSSAPRLKAKRETKAGVSRAASAPPPEAENQNGSADFGPIAIDAFT